MKNDLESRIFAALLEKYRPISILLHGSRAVGKQRPHSDWDIIMLFDVLPLQKADREMFFGECIEWMAYDVRNIDDVRSAFGLHLQYARVLFDSNTKGADLVERARRFYIQGPNLSASQTARERLYFEQKILGLEDDVENDALFFRHFHALFVLSTKLWFELIENRFSQPLYFALPYIKKSDPDYYSALTEFLCSNDRVSIIMAAKKMLNRLFVAHKLGYRR